MQMLKISQVKFKLILNDICKYIVYLLYFDVVQTFILAQLSGVISEFRCLASLCDKAAKSTRLCGCDVI